MEAPEGAYQIVRERVGKRWIHRLVTRDPETGKMVRPLRITPSFLKANGEAVVPIRKRKSTRRKR